MFCKANKYWWKLVLGCLEVFKWAVKEIQQRWVDSITSDARTKAKKIFNKSIRNGWVNAKDHKIECKWCQIVNWGVKVENKE